MEIPSLLLGSYRVLMSANVCLDLAVFLMAFLALYHIYLIRQQLTCNCISFNAIINYVCVSDPQ